MTDTVVSIPSSVSTNYRDDFATIHITPPIQPYRSPDWIKQFHFARILHQVIDMIPGAIVKSYLVSYWQSSTMLDHSAPLTDESVYEYSPPGASVKFCQTAPVVSTCQSIHQTLSSRQPFTQNSFQSQ